MPQQQHNSNNSSSYLAPGLCIAASILVAAGIAIYESEDLRTWLDQRRRQVAIALYGLGDQIFPPSDPSDEASAARTEEMSRRRRAEVVRQNRLAILRRAQSDGVAVDLDELARVGADVEREYNRTQVNDPGIEKKLEAAMRDFKGSNEPSEPSHAASSTLDAPHGTDGLRQRGAGPRGFAMGSLLGALADPFGDNNMTSMIDASDRNASQSTLVTPPQSQQQYNHSDSAVREALQESRVYEESRYKSNAELEDELEKAIRLSLSEETATSTPTRDQLIDVSERSVPEMMEKEREREPESALEDSLYTPSSPPPGESTYATILSHPDMATSTPSSSTSPHSLSTLQQPLPSPPLPSSPLHSHPINLFDPIPMVQYLASTPSHGYTTPPHSTHMTDFHNQPSLIAYRDFGDLDHSADNAEGEQTPGALTPTTDAFSMVSFVAGDAEGEGDSEASWDIQSTAHSDAGGSLRVYIDPFVNGTADTNTTNSTTAREEDMGDTRSESAVTESSEFSVVHEHDGESGRDSGLVTPQDCWSEIESDVDGEAANGVAMGS